MSTILEKIAQIEAEVQYKNDNKVFGNSYIVFVFRWPELKKIKLQQVILVS